MFTYNYTNMESLKSANFCFCYFFSGKMYTDGHATTLLSFKDSR